MNRPMWNRLSPEQQEAVAILASTQGIGGAAKAANVSETAVRRACAVTGIAPKRYERAISKQARIASALALLRSLHLTPQDLMAPQ